MRNNIQKQELLQILRDKLAGIREQVISWRRHFHQHPELGLECHHTAKIVAEQLSELGLDVRTGVVKSGVVGTLNGGAPGPVVALRVDMDALPIQEQTSLSCSSLVPGVMHACGHDGHTALGLGAAALLASVRDSFSGTVKFIFQPGEESPGGAKLMIAEGALENPHVDLLIGCHIHPAFPSGSIGIPSGTVTAGNYEFQITLRGVGGHAARPQQCKDPIVAASHLVIALQTIGSRRIDPTEPVVLSIGEIHGGSGCNIIPEEVRLKGTIRYVDNSTKHTALQELQKIVSGLELQFDVTVTMEKLHDDPPMIISEEFANRTAGIATELFGTDAVLRIPKPSMGSEDFAYFTQQAPCMYFRLGSFDETQGYIHDLHNPHFDFDEAILEKGVLFLAFLMLRNLSAI